MSARLLRLAALLLVPLTAQAADPYPTKDQNTVYALGVLQARQLQGMLLTREELDIFRKGLADGFAGKAKLEPQKRGTDIRSLRAARSKQVENVEQNASLEFVKAAKSERGAVVTDSGLVFRSITDGLGERPTVLDQVTVHYHGTLRDGTVFDSSVERGKPANFALNRVIPCWTEGLQLMKVGGKATLVCPAPIAYGSRGAGSLIRPGAALKFEVELLGVGAP